jgi:hypothetical protein
LLDHQQGSLHRSGRQPHHDAIQVSTTLSSGAAPRDDMYHEKFYTIKRGTNDNLEHPRHHIKVRIFPTTFAMRCYSLENFVKFNQIDGNKCLIQKTQNFEPLPTGKSVVISYLILTPACLNFSHLHLICAWALCLLHENPGMFCFPIFCIINPYESWN